MNVTTFADKSSSISLKTNDSFFKKVWSAVASPRRILLTILIVFAIVGVIAIFNSARGTSTVSKILPLNQKFDVVAKTQDGKTTNGKLNIQLTGAQKATSMLVQGSNVVVHNNKIFLIINMDITNPYMVPLYTYPVDSFRLVASDGKKYAPTTHQGNVEIRPESTKTSNVGFVVPMDEKRFKVEVGDLNADKTTLEFSL